ncbi:MAG: DbpA RNA binding domain-containing protein [Sphaerochaetaceae bacterium]|nr:DbpA RNA binding domain-containing protein [Spirochaetales bacterium]MDY5500789.1 DbpA RNA binding domain-containing protein [Sphaerochaetaceae bacterium]
MDNEENKPDQDQAVITRIQAFAKETKADSNPDELEHLKKLIKRNVPFTLRGYFMAYLLRQLMNGGSRFDRRGQRPQRGEKPQRAPRPQTPENQEASAGTDAPTEQAPAESKPVHEQKPLPEGAKTLYLNIGKMKRLYVKELCQIIQDQIGVTRDDIYAVRIHDKYSFVSMSQENCDKAIEKMNGMDIKGRTITVTYSNKE